MSQYGTQLTTLGAAGGGDDLTAAAEVIADGARQIAGRWSASIPERIEVSVSGTTATISCDAPPAYPAETGARHPLFGDREHWYGPPGPPFLAPALEQRMDPAMARYAQKIDRMCRSNGFR